MCMGYLYSAVLPVVIVKLINLWPHRMPNIYPSHHHRELTGGSAPCFAAVAASVTYDLGYMLGV